MANNDSESDAESMYRPVPAKPSRTTWGRVDGLTRFRTTSEIVGESPSTSDSSIKDCECARPVKSDDCRGTMAKRLTKALRGKRRWVGLNVSNCESRSELESKIKEIAPTEDWRLMDFSNGKAILRILLKDQPKWRSTLDKPGQPIHSVTMSGKIRLVRERLELDSN